MKQLLKKLVLLLPALTLLACESKMTEYYKTPEWLAGSAWEVLEEDGNYSVFLNGAERAGFRPLLEGKGVITVMAPDDAVFGTYLQQKGYSSIEDLDETELKKLIGFHLLYYSFTKERMINFRPEGDMTVGLEETADIEAGLFHKFRTRSSDAPTLEYDRAGNKEVTVYHLERFLPTFSYRFFNTKGIEAKSNYEFFYPNSTWAGDQGFNVSNASVTEYEVNADNGYIYRIDRVLEPLNTIYDEMKARPAFSRFAAMYDSFSRYVYDNNLTTLYAESLGVDSLYLHGHDGLSSIAMEWPTSYYQQMHQLSSMGYSVFAPDNEALEAFFRSYWQPTGYATLDEVDPLAKQMLLGQHVYGGAMVFPQEITDGDIRYANGDPLQFDLSNVSERFVGVNGAFYGIDKMTAPPLFSSVVGAVIKHRNTRSFLYALAGSGVMNAYSASTMQALMLVPQDYQMEAAGYNLNTYTTGTSLQEEGEEGPVNVSGETLTNMVNLHTVNGAEPLKSTGTQVLTTQAAYNYWYIKDGKITSSDRFLRLLVPTNTTDPFVPFTEVTADGGEPWRNGHAYFYDTTDGVFTITSTTGNGLSYTLGASADRNYKYNAFSQLLKTAGLVEITGGVPRIPLLSLYRYIAFIPTEAAIADALAADGIPGITGGSIGVNGEIVVAAADLDKAALASYLTCYFLRDRENTIPVYPYPGSLMRSGAYKTIGAQHTLNYTDTGSSLSVQLDGGSVVNVIPEYDYFPFAYNDGCFHFIDAIL